MAYLNEEERANLVAYLDGELDEAKARALEARLSTDPRARAEADSLRRTWDLLDYLPRTEASTSFTHRTLEKLAVQTGVRPIVRRRLPWWLRAAAWAAAVLLAAGAGLGAANLLWPRPPPAGRRPPSSRRAWRATSASSATNACTSTSMTSSSCGSWTTPTCSATTKPPGEIPPCPAAGEP